MNLTAPAQRSSPGPGGDALRVVELPQRPRNGHICHELTTLDFSYFREIDVSVLTMSIITLDFSFTYSQT